MVTGVRVPSVQRFTRRTDQTDYDLDSLDPNLPLRYAVQGLYGTDPSQETCPKPCRLHGSLSAT